MDRVGDQEVYRADGSEMTAAENNARGVELMALLGAWAMCITFVYLTQVFWVVCAIAAGVGVTLYVVAALVSRGSAQRAATSLRKRTVGIGIRAAVASLWIGGVGHLLTWGLPGREITVPGVARVCELVWTGRSAIHMNGGLWMHHPEGAMLLICDWEKFGGWLGVMYLFLALGVGVGLSWRTSAFMLVFGYVGLLVDFLRRSDSFMSLDSIGERATPSHLMLFQDDAVRALVLSVAIAAAWHWVRPDVPSRGRTAE